MLRECLLYHYEGQYVWYIRRILILGVSEYSYIFEIIKELWVKGLHVLHDGVDSVTIISKRIKLDQDLVTFLCLICNEHAS